MKSEIGRVQQRPAARQGSRPLPIRNIGGSQTVALNPLFTCHKTRGT